MLVNVGDKKVKRWILDSTCFCYMCPHRDWLGFNKTTGVKVNMSKNSSCEVLTAGRLKIRIFNRLMRTLAGVYHVLSLKTNTSSLCFLVQKDAQCMLVIS